MPKRISNSGLTYFFERQTFAVWVNSLIVFSMLAPLPAVLIWSHEKGTWQIAIVLIFLLLLMAGVIGVMETTLDEAGIHVAFGFFQWIKYDYPWADLNRYEARTYKPLTEYGGWGIRGFGNRIALNMRGNRGVELFLANARQGGSFAAPIDRSVMIGTQQPEAFIDAIARALSSNGQW